MIKPLIQKAVEYLRRKKTTPSPSHASPTQEQPDSTAQKSGKSRLLIKGIAGLAVVAMGFVVGGVVMNSVKTTKEPPFQMKLGSGSNLPKQPPPASQPSSQDISQQPNQIPSQSPGMSPQASKDIPASTMTSPATPAIANKQDQGLRMAKREANTRPVSEYDPFKSEFKQKYEEQEKKDKKSHNKSGGDASLSELEKGLKAKPVMPVVPIPPPPPPAKELKLNVYGTVVSKGGDSYAVTDRGVIRVGSNIESFRVEKIDFDIVTVKSRDNEKDVRSLFVTAKTVGHPGATATTATTAVNPVTPR